MKEFSKILVKKIFKWIILKIFQTNDTPFKIASGFGLGVFLGIFPGTGPLAALFLASLFKVNRGTALVGSLISNTWLSIFIFLISLKVGSFILNLNWQEIHKELLFFLKNFNLIYLTELTFLKVIFPLIIGYFIIAFLAGFLAYIFVSLILILHKKKF